MKTKIAYCGLNCESCPIHVATLETDKSKQQSLRKSIAEQCKQLYNMNLQIEDITDCDGCHDNAGRIYKGCLNCEIRICAIQKQLENCAFCLDYPCNLLKKHFEQDPESEKKLLEIRSLK